MACPEMNVLDEAEWSLENCNLVSVLLNQQYPLLLRLVGNVYSDKHVHIEENDVVVLKDCLFKYALKARMCKYDYQHGYVTGLSDSEEIFLPLGCMQKGVVRPLVVDFSQETFHCASDLGINFPRFVRLRNDMVLLGGKDDDKTTCVISKDEILEVLRWEYESDSLDSGREIGDDSSDVPLDLPLYEIVNNWSNHTVLPPFKNMRLICSWNDKLVALPSNIEIELEGILDPTEYVILDIFERFPSPQGFLFLNEEKSAQIEENSYHGCYILKEICPVFILNGYHIKCQDRRIINRFRLPLVTEDADLLKFSIGKVTSGSPMDLVWRDDTSFLIQRSQSLSTPFTDNDEVTRRRHMSFHSSISGKYMIEEMKDEDSKVFNVD